MTKTIKKDLKKNQRKNFYIKTIIFPLSKILEIIKSLATGLADSNSVQLYTLIF